MINYGSKRVISEGGIVAVKGIGGFHLCCDASNEAAVSCLRQRKRRPAKPFAVMAKDLEAVKVNAKSAQNSPKFSLDIRSRFCFWMRKEEAKQLCSSVAPGNPKVGVMLPYAPVQLLIFTYDDGIKMPEFLVMTSGNISGAPICRDG